MSILDYYFIMPFPPKKVIYKHLIDAIFVSIGTTARYALVATMLSCKFTSGSFARYAFVIQRCLLGSFLRPLIYRCHDDNTLGITTPYVVAKYPENKIVRFCAMGVFRSQSPRA